MPQYDRMDAIRINNTILQVRKIFAEKDGYAIFETETTGLGDHDVVLWLSIMDLDGNMLFDELLKLPPRKRINPVALDLHGVDRSILKKEGKEFIDILPGLEDILTARKMLIFNARFHERLFRQTFEQHGLQPIPLPHIDVQLMQNLITGRSYSRLQGRDNTGEGDCEAVLQLLLGIRDMELLDVTPLATAPPMAARPPAARKRFTWWGGAIAAISGLFLFFSLLLAEWMAVAFWLGIFLFAFFVGRKEVLA